MQRRPSVSPRKPSIDTLTKEINTIKNDMREIKLIMQKPKRKPLCKDFFALFGLSVNLNDGGADDSIAMLFTLLFLLFLLGAADDIMNMLACAVHRPPMALQGGCCLFVVLYCGFLIAKAGKDGYERTASRHFFYYFGALLRQWRVVLLIGSITTLSCK
jgi:hypothetical protein